MGKVAGRIAVVVVCVVGIVSFSGCTNWEKKYNALDVEHQNLKGLYENCQSTLDTSALEKASLQNQVSQSQHTIDDLQRQIQEGHKSAGEATGFGDKYPVDVDAAEGTITVTLPQTILFEPGKAGLKSSSKGDLNHIISVLKERYGNNRIDIVGHTDSDPIKKSSWKDNWELSAHRSLEVVRYLESNGIEAKRLRIVGCGESRPVASNSSASGKAKNRRVEIVVRTR